MPPKKVTNKLPDLAIVSVIADRDADYGIVVDADEIDEYAALGMLFAATWSQLMRVLPDTAYGYFESDGEGDDEDD